MVFGRLKLKIAQLNDFNGSEFVASHMFLSATAWDLRRSLFSKRKGLLRKLFDGVIFLLYFSWQKINLFICFFGCCLNRHFGFLFRKTVLGDAFDNILNSIVGFACFGLKHATIVVEGWCVHKLNRSRISMISRVDF